MEHLSNEPTSDTPKLMQRLVIHSFRLSRGSEQIQDGLLDSAQHYYGGFSEADADAAIEPTALSIRTILTKPWHIAPVLNFVNVYDAAERQIAKLITDAPPVYDASTYPVASLGTAVGATDKRWAELFIAKRYTQKVYTSHLAKYAILGRTTGFAAFDTVYAAIGMGLPSSVEGSGCSADDLMNLVLETHTQANPNDREPLSRFKSLLPQSMDACTEAVP